MLVVGEFERALAQARDRVKLEELRARQALEAEVSRRRDLLQRVADQIAPVLSEIRELDLVLGRVLDPRAVGTGLSWPRDLVDEVAFGNAAMTAGIRVA